MARSFNPYGPGGGGVVETSSTEVAAIIREAQAAASEAGITDIPGAVGAISSYYGGGGYAQGLGPDRADRPVAHGVGLGAGAGVIGGVEAVKFGTVTPPAPAVAAVPAALGALGAAVPAVAGIAGGLAAGYGVLQALGLGEGGGLFGNNLLGGDEFTMGGVPFGGPGLAEPPRSMVLKEWHVKYDWGTLQYYMVQLPGRGRKIAMYNTRTKQWKVWSFRTPRLAVIGKNMPSHKQITRLRRNLSKHRTDAESILKLTSPQYVAYKSRKRSRRR
jgi:hypothetical protein